MNCFLGWPLLTTFPPALADTEGWLSSSNEDLFEFKHHHVPKPSTRLSIPAWSAVRWWCAGPFTREHGCTESQHWPTPCCFALRDANTGRLHRLLELAAQRSSGLPLAASPGRSPSEKAEGHSETHASQKDCRLQRAASSALQKPWLSVLPNENRILKKKKKKTTAALEATNVNNDMLLRAFTCSKSSRTF